MDTFQGCQGLPKVAGGHLTLGGPICLISAEIALYEDIIDIYKKFRCQKYMMSKMFLDESFQQCLELLEPLKSG